MFLKQFLQRAEFCSLQNFLKNGCETWNVPPDKTYLEQLNDARKYVTAFFEEKFPDESDREKALALFDEQTDVYENVFFEMGIIVGAKIGMQLQKRLQEMR